MIVRLKDVCIKGTSNIRQKDVNESGRYPVYGAAGPVGFMNSFQYDEPYVGVVKDGAGIGRATYLPSNSSIIGTMQALIPKNNVLPKYLYYAVSSMHLEKYYSGATIPHIYFKNYKHERFVLVSKKEQEQIIWRFSLLEKMISNKQQQLLKLDELIKARFVEMFGDPGIPQNKWKNQSLKEHISVIGGYAFSSKKFSDSGIPVLRIGNINTGYFKSTNLVYWQESDTLQRYLVYPGELVMSLTGTVGKQDYGNVCILDDSYPRYYLNQRNAKIVINDAYNTIYLKETLEFPVVKQKLTGTSRGVRQANISNKDILNLTLSVPPLSLQNEFANFVQQVDKSKVAVQKSLNETQKLYDSLMQEYFG